MDNSDLVVAEGMVRRGHRVASGTAAEGDTRFNALGGSIALQVPHFKARGLDLAAYFGGGPSMSDIMGRAGYVSATIGIDLAPWRLCIKNPEYDFDGIRWTDVFDSDIPGFREGFFLSAAQLIYAEREYKALIYIPKPETKPAHFQPATVVEVIAQPVPGLCYGDRIRLRYQATAIALV